jgi:hypothetical protein
MEITVQDPETGVVYRSSPARDVAFFLPQLVADLEARLAPGRLTPRERQRLRDEGQVDEQGRLSAVGVKRAFAGLLQFFSNATDPDIKTVIAAIQTGGFLEAPAVAQELVLQKFAQVLLGACWAGIRSSVMDGECPPLLTILKRRGLQLLDALSREEDSDHAHQPVPGGASAQPAA